MATVFLTVTPRRRAIGRFADKAGEGRLDATPEDIGTFRLRFASIGYAEIGLQCCLILAEQNKSHRASLFGERSTYVRYHRAPPGRYR